MNSKIPVIIWGATGFTGGELLRIIARHPYMEIAGAVSRSKAGTPIGAIHPHLRFAYPDVNFISPEEGGNVDARLVFLALPHKAAAETAKKRLSAGQKVVDLSADFRLRDHEQYKRWYETEHPCPELLEGAVYGLPELHRHEMAGAKLISGVGCNATSAIFALLPLAKAGLIESARIECRVGSSEGGAGSQRRKFPFAEKQIAQSGLSFPAQAHGRSHPGACTPRREHQHDCDSRGACKGDTVHSTCNTQQDSKGSRHLEALPRAMVQRALCICFTGKTGPFAYT